MSVMLGRKAIGTCAYMGGVPAVLESFCWSWGQMVQYNQEVFLEGRPASYVHYDRASISDHGPARNHLAARFLGDWLVQMDTDHRFDPDIVARLVRIADRYDIDVLSAFYQMKSPPHAPVVYQWVKLSGQPALQPMAFWPKEAEVLQVGSAGGGCLFVRRRVFETLAKAYPGAGPFDRIHPFSEDHSFFMRCKEQGIKGYAAMRVLSEHLRVHGVTPDDLPPPGSIVASEPFAVEGFTQQ